MSELKVLTFDKAFVHPNKIARTHTITGKCISAQDYVTPKGNIPGVIFMIEGVPYKLRVLSGSLTGGFTAKEFVRCTVQFTGTMRKHEEREYFNPRDARIVKKSALADLAVTGVAYSGSLD
jgi:hypothetical protein